MSKSTWLTILGGIAVGLTAALGAASAGILPAIGVGIGAAAAFLAGRNQPSPAAVAAFGKDAK